MDRNYFFDIKLSKFTISCQDKRKQLLSCLDKTFSYATTYVRMSHSKIFKKISHFHRLYFNFTMNHFVIIINMSRSFHLLFQEKQHYLIIIISYFGTPPTFKCFRSKTIQFWGVYVEFPRNFFMRRFPN